LRKGGGGLLTGPWLVVTACTDHLGLGPNVCPPDEWLGASLEAAPPAEELGNAEAASKFAGIRRSTGPS
jgi:hypothetical protein